MTIFRRKMNQRIQVQTRFSYCFVELASKYSVLLIANEIDLLIYSFVEFAMLFARFD